jgi:hypothetical protein
MLHSFLSRDRTKRDPYRDEASTAWGITKFEREVLAVELPEPGLGIAQANSYSLRAIGWRRQAYTIILNSQEERATLHLGADGDPSRLQPRAQPVPDRVFNQGL